MVKINGANLDEDVVRKHLDEYTCPKCNQPGLRSIYFPTCTVCANTERRKSGEIKDDNTPPVKKFYIAPPHFPDWFRNLVYAGAVVVMILTVLDWTFCPPCQICIGTRIGQICIEKLPEEIEWLHLARL